MNRILLLFLLFAPTVLFADMIKLSKDTEAVVDALFEGKQRKEMKRRLLEECSENIPFQEGSSPKEMERIRFAVIKLCNEAKISWNECFELAELDWRDLFMAAGFGYDTKEHLKWRKEVLTKRAR